MVRLSSIVVTLNFLTFLLSIPIISAGIWLAVREKSDCEYFLRWPVICLGVFLMFVSLVGFIAACFRVKWLLCLYLLVMFFLIVLLLCFTIVAFVVTNKGAGHSVEKNGYKEYRLGDYSKWLQKQVEKSSNWNKIRSCIQDSKVCNNVTGESQKKLSAIQSGCCKPPTACGFHYDNVTHWNQHTGMKASKDSDCKIWSNDENKLCYDCNSCRAGVVASVKDDWQNIALVDVVVLIALVVVYSIGCCALKNDERVYDRFGRKGYP
ncbi:hypothetical protein SUGI_0239170 [Cryptomeria japonica]|uniref:tetraspanin-8 n=1 Tax=Cryptomeria japonica TaxID=3369 RepID=UPI002408A41D|nr:tetraspanin-8 [Cryptomeria japonica]GLJ14750.1 hypothetical protein SUGI_0239170 [Cryptomeria japonica]